MTHDDELEPPPFNPIWLAHEYEYEVSKVGGMIDPPQDQIRRAVELLARQHPNWGPEQIKLELESPSLTADYRLPTVADVSALAINVVLDQLRQNS